MFARIAPVRNGKVMIEGAEYTLEEALKLPFVEGVGKDDEGHEYVILKS